MTENNTKFEDILDRLDKIIEEMEMADTGIDKSLVLYQQAMDLAAASRKILDAAEQSVRLLHENAVGELVSEDFDMGDD